MPLKKSIELTKEAEQNGCVHQCFQGNARVAPLDALNSAHRHSKLAGQVAARPTALASDLAETLTQATAGSRGGCSFQA